MRLPSLITLLALGLGLGLGVVAAPSESESERQVSKALSLAEAAEDDHVQRASKQFGLRVIDQASLCFLTCHSAATQVAMLPKRGINSPVFISLNCKLPLWVKIMGECLPMVCKSAPDVAYALEYADSWCNRGGVKDVQFRLPAWYLETPGGQYNAKILASSAVTRYNVFYSSVVVWAGVTIVAFLGYIL